MKIKTLTVSNARSEPRDMNRLCDQPSYSITVEIEEGDNVQEITRNLQIDVEVALAQHADLIKQNREVLDRALQNERRETVQMSQDHLRFLLERQQHQLSTQSIDWFPPEQSPRQK